MSSTPVELDVEPIIGWRGWHLRLTPAGPELVPAGRGPAGWPSRAPMTAGCSHGREHRSPHPACSCGLYAYKSQTALRSLRARLSVIGTVALWGRIVEHEHGWRAEHAYPDRLRLVCEECLPIRADLRAGVPVLAGTSSAPGASPAFASAWCATHVPTRLGQSWPAPELGEALLSRYAVDLMPVERIDTTTRPRRWNRRPVRTSSLDHVLTTKANFDPPGLMRYLR